jgi:4-hydroxy-4-methyl-2-oxoglutarate aldolase
MATQVHTKTLNRIEPARLQKWADVPVTITSDITNGRVLVDPRIRPLCSLPLSKSMVGQAVTAWCERADFGPVLHAIDLAGEGDIVAVDAGGSVEMAYVGEVLSGAARQKKIAGLIVNGAVRDIDTIASWEDFPVYCLGNTARGPLSKERGSVNGPIVFGGILIKPGDVVLGDNDGLAVIPAEEAERLLSMAMDRISAEGEWKRQLAAGRTLADVFSVPDAI